LAKIELDPGGGPSNQPEILDLACALLRQLDFTFLIQLCFSSFEQSGAALDATSQEMLREHHLGQREKF